MRTVLLPALGLLALSAVASAQSQDLSERRGYVSLGIYIPQSIDGLDQNIGASLAVGGNLVIREKYRVSLELRGSANRIGDDDDATLSVSSIFANYSTRPMNGKGFFFGGGLGLGKASIESGNITFSDDDVQFLYTAFVGLDFTKTTYGLARYQGSGEEGYRGFSVEFGYRF